MKFGKKTLAIALLFIGLVLINYLASNIPARVDSTAERIYTLSPGTKALLSKIEEPITLDFYYTQGAGGMKVDVKNYADRVHEMLKQYVRASRGKITLNMIDPEPDTPEEEKATGAGLKAQRMQTGGDPFYLGIVATQADQQKNIPTLNPDREQFLEYDLSKMIYGVQQVDKKRLGLLTSLPLQGTQPNMMTGQPGSENQYVVSEWLDTFQIVHIEENATELPDNLDALAVIHPENVPPRLQYAIDQYLLAGKPVFIAVDPSSQYFKRIGSQGMMFGGPPPNLSSDLPELFSAWGIDYDAKKIVGDNETAMQVQLQNGSVVRDPIWLGLRSPNFNSKSLATAQLSSMLFIEPGAISAKAGSALTFTPLVQTSPKAGVIDGEDAQFAQPDDIAHKLAQPGMRTIAAIVTGTFKTAFPDGPPKEEKKPEDKKEPEKPLGPQLKQSKAGSTLMLITDTDWLFDDYSLRKVSLMGQSAAQPINDNLAFAANALDFLSGSQDLVSIRGKGNSIRPFTVVAAMEAQANQKYQEKLTGLEKQLSDVQSKIQELQGQQSDGGRLVATPEVTKAIEDFQKQAAVLRGELRKIRLALRQDIDALENRLLALNLLAVPLLVCLFGVWFHRARKK